MRYSHTRFVIPEAAKRLSGTHTLHTMTTGSLRPVFTLRSVWVPALASLGRDDKGRGG